MVSESYKRKQAARRANAFEGGAIPDMLKGMDKPAQTPKKAPVPTPRPSKNFRKGGFVDWRK